MTTQIRYGTRPFAPDLALGACGQLLLLALLGSDGRVGPRWDGWPAGCTRSATWALLTLALRRSWTGPFGPANRVTLARAMLVGGVTALVADSFGGRPPRRDTDRSGRRRTAPGRGRRPGRPPDRDGRPRWARASTWRSTPSSSWCSASFVAGSVGAWVLRIGAMRYAFVAASWVLPWLRGALPPRVRPQDGGGAAGHRAGRGGRRGAAHGRRRAPR